MCRMKDNCKDLELTSQPSVDHSARYNDDDEQGQVRADGAHKIPMFQKDAQPRREPR